MTDRPDALIVNTGGTLNKRYDPITGELYVPRDNQAVTALLAPFADNLNVVIEGRVFKDSLQMDAADRAEIEACIREWPALPVLIIHGTDTMNLTAAHLAETLPDRRIVLTGAMQPFAFGGLEAMSNVALSIGFLLADAQGGVFIGMHGLVRPHDRIVKQRERGLFRALSRE